MPRFFPVLLLVGASLVSAQEVKGPELTNYEVLSEVLTNKTIPDLVVLDVRSPEEFAEGHIPGAVNLPLERVFYDFPSKSAVAPLLVYGRPASADARKAVDILRTRGYRNVILFGSISQWKGDLQ
jgi:rhodanese-related sulfurtransferase